KPFVAVAFVSVCLVSTANTRTLPAWRGHAANAQHTARAPAPGQSLATIHWTMSVDHAPPSRARKGNVPDELLIHYASPMITGMHTVLIPVKTSSSGDFEIDAVKERTGKTLWALTTDYVLPPHDWVPPLPAHL